MFRWRIILCLLFLICDVYSFSSPAFAQDKKAGCQDIGEPAFEINISVPQPIILGEWFDIKFSIRNTGTAGAYFKIPWKWATNGMFLRAIDDKGKAYDSVRYFDIDSEASACTHFIPIEPGAMYEFEWGFSPSATFEISPGTIEFSKPGKYRLQWIYNPVHWEEHDQCAAGGWPIWKMPLESREIEVTVLPKKHPITSIKSK